MSILKVYVSQLFFGNLFSPVPFAERKLRLQFNRYRSEVHKLINVNLIN